MMWKNLSTSIKLASPIAAFYCLWRTKPLQAESSSPQPTTPQSPTPGLKDPRVDLVYSSDNGGGQTKYLKWEDYFMAITLLAERRCKDICQTRAGASIFDETNKIVGIGNTSKILHKDAECHAELNAVLNRNINDLKNSKMYVSNFPCNECAKCIIQSGIKSVVYYTNKKGTTEATQKEENDPYKDSKYMLEEAEVNFKFFKTFLRQITIDLRETPKENEDSITIKTPLTDEEFFMAMAFVASARSKDPRTQVGACIVNEEKKVVGIGFNGMPLRFNDANTNWGKVEKHGLPSKDPIVCHAEMNAVLFGNAAEMQNSTIYVTLFPCEECAKVVIKAGIKKVYFYSDKNHDRNPFSRKLLGDAGLEPEQFNPRPGREKIVINIERLDERCT
uniref:dCMP deaminase n=1 Tax=Crassostrea virginica TaxID=6565 RepID=A0A8B8DB83_CRAVI|nr:uncharacterized protein LOC111125606 isoform X2 [Crassostrea virginica]